MLISKCDLLFPLIKKYDWKWCEDTLYTFRSCLSIKKWAIFLNKNSGLHGIIILPVYITQSFGFLRILLKKTQSHLSKMDIFAHN